jgi:hypothetical protein
VGITTDWLPPENVSASDQQARLGAGLNYQYYSDNNRILRCKWNFYPKKVTEAPENVSVILDSTYLNQADHKD